MLEFNPSQNFSQDISMLDDRIDISTRSYAIKKKEKEADPEGGFSGRLLIRPLGRRKCFVSGTADSGYTLSWSDRMPSPIFTENLLFGSQFLSCSRLL